MIAFRQLALQRGGTPLITSADVRINDGSRVGIVGPNGAGKSSLFKLLLGELTPDQGSIDYTNGLRMAHMAQELDALDRPIVEVVMDGDPALREVEHSLEAARDAGDNHREAELHGHFDALDGYTARSRAEQLLMGLGFTQPQLGAPLSDFSGGWRMRVNQTFTTVEDVAETALYLVTFPSTALTGQSILVSHGWYMQ